MNSSTITNSYNVPLHARPFNPQLKVLQYRSKLVNILSECQTAWIWTRHQVTRSLSFEVRLPINFEEKNPSRFGSFHENCRQLKSNQNALRNFYRLCPPIACDVSSCSYMYYTRSISFDLADMCDNSNLTHFQGSVFCPLNTQHIFSTEDGLCEKQVVYCSFAQSSTELLIGAWK